MKEHGVQGRVNVYPTIIKNKEWKRISLLHYIHFTNLVTDLVSFVQFIIDNNGNVNY